MRNTALPSLLGQKLKTIRADHGLTQDEFCAALEEKPSKIRDIESGRQRVNDEFLAKLVKRFPIDLNWLFDVGGFEGRHGNQIDAPARDLPAHGDFRFDGEEFAMISRWDLSVSAGMGLLPVEGGEKEALAFSRSWLLRNGINADLAVLVRIKGDSMAPTIPDGALVLVHAAEMVVEHEGIYAFTRDGAVYVKRLIPMSHDIDGRAAGLVILSDNMTYGPETVSGEAMNELRVVGRVRCAMVTF